MLNTTGALFPPEFQWMMGKTAASIAFARDAEALMEKCADIEKVARLALVVDAIKKGTLSLKSSHLDAEDFLSIAEVVASKAKEDVRSGLRVELQSETGISMDPARVRVYDGDKLVCEVVAEFQPQQGADGGYYHCIVLKKKQG